MLRGALEGPSSPAFEAPRAREQRRPRSPAIGSSAWRPRGKHLLIAIRGRSHPAYAHAHDGFVADVPARRAVACRRKGRRRRADGARGRGVLRGAGGGAARRSCGAPPSRARRARSRPLPPRSRPRRDRAPFRSTRPRYRDRRGAPRPTGGCRHRQRLQVRGRVRMSRGPVHAARGRWTATGGRTCGGPRASSCGATSARHPEGRRRTAWPSTTVRAVPAACAAPRSRSGVRARPGAPRGGVPHVNRGRRRRPMARSGRRPPAEDRTCNTARRGTPRRRRAVGDRAPLMPWPRRPARSRSSGEAMPSTRRSRRPSRSR